MKTKKPVTCLVDGPRDIEPNRKETYEQFRERILENGGFTVFFACENQRNARMCRRLCRDKTLLVKNLQFPSYSVERIPEGLL